MFEFSKSIEQIKVVHALSLACIGLFLVVFTRKFKVLNKTHYRQMLALTMIVTILYILPIFVICYKSYKDVEFTDIDLYAGFEVRDSGRSDWEKAVAKFADWIIMLIYRTDLGWFGVFLSFLIHAQIYILLFVMQCCASSVDDIQQRIKR